MGNPAGGHKEPMSEKQMRDAVDAVLEKGSVSGAAKKLKLTRQSVQHRLKMAEEAGMTVPKRHEANPSRWRPGAEIVAARKAEFERLERSVRYDGNIIYRPDDGPFMLILHGDWHLDNAGTSLSLLERWLRPGNRSKHITHALAGDLLDQWVRVLAHLYGQAETTAPEGYILLEHYLDQIAEDLDFSIGGNHDGWAGHHDVLGRMMEERGVLHRGSSLRVRYVCPSGREITVHGRHSWQGRSQWSEVHALKKAARLGVRDTILFGGHTHVSGEGMEKDPITGKYTFVYQLASYKLIDDYADTLGLLDRHTSPAIALVIDPRKADTDPDLVKHFYCPEMAADYLALLRRKAVKKVVESAG